MKYKKWFWICLGISIVFMTIGILIANKRAYNKSYLEHLIRSKEQLQKTSDSIDMLYDSIVLTVEYDEWIGKEIEYYKKIKLITVHTQDMELSRTVYIEILLEYVKNWKRNLEQR